MPSKRVPKLVVRKRVLTDDEWEGAISETPSKSDMDLRGKFFYQLDDSNNRIPKIGPATYPNHIR